MSPDHITTDVFGFLMGDGFVMMSGIPTPSEVARRRSEALDELGKLDGVLLWPDIKDDVAEMENFLK